MADGKTGPDTRTGPAAGAGRLEAVARIAGVLTAVQLAFVAFLLCGGGFHPPENADRGVLAVAALLAWVFAILAAAAVKVRREGRPGSAAGGAERRFPA